MSKVNSLLSQRLKRGGQSKKMTALAQDSARGNMTSFSGVFQVAELSDQEQHHLRDLLAEYSTDSADVESDLKQLSNITSEVRAITNQAAILHGERIKRAQQLLKTYRDGAFTAWLLSTYGNRQTPYNFLQYYEFHQQIPSDLRPQLERMPRQAVYTLASRNGEFENKQKLVEDYDGQTKDELLQLIRELFPLNASDGRHRSSGDALVQSLSKLHSKLTKQKAPLSSDQKDSIRKLVAMLAEVADRF